MSQIERVCIFYIKVYKLNLLLLGHTDGSSSSTSGLGMLTSDTETPEVTNTTMGTNLLQSFEIFTKFGVQSR